MFELSTFKVHVGRQLLIVIVIAVVIVNRYRIFTCWNGSARGQRARHKYYALAAHVVAMEAAPDYSHP